MAATGSIWRRLRTGRGAQRHRNRAADRRGGRERERVADLAPARCFGAAEGPGRREALQQPWAPVSFVIPAVPCRTSAAVGGQANSPRRGT